MNFLLQRISNALTSIEGLKVYHYWRPQMDAPFCVWQEEQEGDSLWASNHKKEFVLTGTIDYYTKKDFDPIVDQIQAVMDIIENFGWTLDAVLYENETELIHYSWSWQIA